LLLNQSKFSAASPVGQNSIGADTHIWHVRDRVRTVSRISNLPRCCTANIRQSRHANYIYRSAFRALAGRRSLVLLIGALAAP
jgi:hypothetical protein